MPAKDGGYFSRMVHKLTSDVDELDADDLSAKSAAGGAQRASECSAGEEVTMLGRLRSVELCPSNEVATLEAELFDGTEGVILVWLGRRKIPGIEPGRILKVHGRLADRDGHKVLYNPYYELQNAQ
ncbi:MAG: OB-fold nucleic acid binding domain-containing protein [Haloechinothrix sp.]